MKCPTGVFGRAASRKEFIRVDDGVAGLESHAGVLGVEPRFRPKLEKLSIGVAGAECDCRVMAGPGSTYVEYARAECTAGDTMASCPSIRSCEYLKNSRRM